MHVSDDLYLGAFFGPQGFDSFLTGTGNPTMQDGVGPMGRIWFQNFVPLTAGTTNVATATAVGGPSAPQVLTAGTGVTKTTAPDGTGAAVYQFDVERAVSLTSTSNLSALTFTVVGYDIRGNKMSQALAGPNNNTVNTKKAFFSVLSVTASASNAGTVSVGSSDIFGLIYVVADAGYIVSVGWANTLARDAGTFTKADTTSPATASTGDTCGTYLPSSASDGTKRLVLGIHLNAGQCGSSPLVTNLIGVAQA